MVEEGGGVGGVGEGLRGDVAGGHRLEGRRACWGCWREVERAVWSDEPTWPLDVRSPGFEIDPPSSSGKPLHGRLTSARRRRCVCLGLGSDELGRGRCDGAGVYMMLLVVSGLRVAATLEGLCVLTPKALVRGRG